MSLDTTTWARMGRGQSQHTDTPALADVAPVRSVVTLVRSQLGGRRLRATPGLRRSRRRRSSAPAGKLERALEREIIETLADFLNTDGGTLIIGVKDDQTIVGIEVDYPRVKGTRDGWCLTFDHLVTHQLGAEVMACIDLRLEPWDDHTIAVIRCSARAEPTWVGEELYVRYAASTEKLSTRHAVAWWRQRWG
jgi:predicted HTH transcriptional regulator